MVLLLKIVVIVVSVILTLVGCNTSLINQHAKEFDTLNGLAVTAAKQLGNGNVGQYQVGAQGINPGVRLSAGVEYFAEARYVGLAGQMQAGASGTFNKDLSPEELAEVNAVLGAQYRTDAEKQAAKLALLRRLGAKIPATADPASVKLDVK